MIKTAFVSMNLPFEIPTVTVHDFCDDKHNLTTTRSTKDYDVTNNNNSILSTGLPFTQWTPLPEVIIGIASSQNIDSGVDDENEEENLIDDDKSKKLTLPPRYTKFTNTQHVFLARDRDNPIHKVVKEDNTHQELSKGCGSSDEDESYNTMERRERDMNVALAWIRQEMNQMRKQNTSLLKQFNELRAGIVQLRYTGPFLSHGSLSDLSSVDAGSCGSLTDTISRTASKQLLSVDEHDWLGNSHSGKKSVSLPCSPIVVRSRKIRSWVLGDSTWDGENLD